MSRQRVAGITVGCALALIGLLTMLQFVAAQQRHGQNLYAYRVLHEDVFVTLGKVHDEWVSFTSSRGGGPRTVEEFLDARPSLKRAIEPRIWANERPFELFAPPIEVEGRRVIALSPAVEPWGDPRRPFLLRFGPNGLRDRRYVVTERGEIEPASLLPAGWQQGPQDAR